MSPLTRQTHGASYLPNEHERLRVISAVRAWIHGQNGGEIMAAIRITDLFLGATFDLGRAGRMIAGIPGVRRDYSHERGPQPFIDLPVSNCSVLAHDDFHTPTRVLVGS